MYGTWRRWWRWVEEGRRADDEAGREELNRLSQD